MFTQTESPGFNIYYLRMAETQQICITVDIFYKIKSAAWTHAPRSRPGTSYAAQPQYALSTPPDSRAITILTFNTTLEPPNSELRNVKPALGELAASVMQTSRAVYGEDQQVRKRGIPEIGTRVIFFYFKVIGQMLNFYHGKAFIFFFFNHCRKERYKKRMAWGSKQHLLRTRIVLVCELQEEPRHPSWSFFQQSSSASCAKCWKRTPPTV
jgi:hypothetical protein